MRIPPATSMSGSSGSETKMSISLLVLRCADIEKGRLFYESFGFVFTKEKHGKGPEHFSTLVGSTVLELYPHMKKETSGLRFGLIFNCSKDCIQHVEILGGQIISADPIVIKDPDGHTIEIQNENFI